MRQSDQQGRLLRHLRFFLSLLLAAAAIIFLSAQISLPNLQGALRAVQPGWLMAALALALAGQIAKALRWRVLLSAGSVHAALLTLLKFLLLGQLANLFIPARAGDIGRAVVLGSRGPGKLFTLGTVALEKVLDLVAFAALGALLLVLAPLPGGIQASPAMTGLIAGLSVISLWGAARTWPTHLAPALRRLTGLAPSRVRPQLLSALDAAGRTLEAVRNRRSAAGLILWTAVVWISGLLVNQLVFTAFGLDLPATAALMLLVVLQAGITAGLSPGSIGVFEFLCLVVLRNYDVPDDQALAYGLVLHAVVLAPLVAALPFAAVRPRRSADESQAGRVKILGVGVDPVRRTDVLDVIRRAFLEKGKVLITHVHVKGLNLAYTTPWMRTFFESADIVYCDGQGVRLGAALLGKNLPERFTLADWMDDLLTMCREADASIYFLGNPPGVAEKAAARLAERHPGLRIAGAYHGYFDRSPESEENEAVISRINESGADILLVGMGMPIQERWLLENRARLRPTVVMTVGGVFEYYSGNLRRAPAWMTENGLEWLALTLQAPLRYGRRYLIGNPLFVFRVLRQRFLGAHQGPPM